MFGGKFLIVHQGHVHAVRKAAAMVDTLYIIVTHNPALERESYFSNSKLDPISVEQRLRWWHQITKDNDNIKVYSVEEPNTNSTSNPKPDWQACATKIKAIIAKPIDIVFSSELSYSHYFDSLYPNARHVIIDSQRQAYPISASQIRYEGVIKHWQQLPDAVKPYFAKSVVIIGTESTGKTTLARTLADAYHTSWVEEAGRNFYKDIGAEIVLLEDFAQIAYQHKYNERQARKSANKVYFVDTEAITTQLFSMIYLDVRQKVLDEMVSLQHYDLWLFLEPDVTWVADGLRSFGDDEQRQKHNQLLKSLLVEFNISYHSISGNYAKRYKIATTYIDKLLVQ